LVLLEGEIVAAGFYPTREQFAKLLHLQVEDPKRATSDSCCQDGGCCG
jgi:hypothetical protein